MAEIPWFHICDQNHERLYRKWSKYAVKRKARGLPHLSLKNWLKDRHPKMYVAAEHEHERNVQNDVAKSRWLSEQFPGCY